MRGVETIDGVYPADDKNSLSFLLPCNFTLTQIANTLRELDKILNQSLVNKKFKGEIKVSHFDRGSEWINIILGSSASLVFFASMVRLYYESKERAIKIKAKEKLLEDVELEVEYRQIVRDSILKKLEVEDNKAYDELLEKYSIPKKDNEYNERLKNSCKSLKSLLDSGVQVHPAITNETKSVEILPDAKKLLDMIKMLPENTEENKVEPATKLCPQHDCGILKLVAASILKNNSSILLQMLRQVTSTLS